MAVGRPKTTHRAIVLQVRNVGEGHRLVDAWLFDEGRVGLWARHARSSKRRYAGALNPFAEVQVNVTRSDALWQLESADLTQDRLGIRNSLASIGRAATLCRMVQALWPQGHHAQGVFEGLTVALDHLSAHKLARAAGLYPRLAELAGFLPDVYACGACHRVNPQALAAPKEVPYIVCAACAPKACVLTPAQLAGLRGGRIEDAAAADVIEQIVAQWAGLFTGTALTPWKLPTT